MNEMTEGERVRITEEYEPPERRNGVVEKVLKDGSFGVRYDDGELVPYEPGDKHMFTLMSSKTNRPHRRALFNAVIAPFANGAVSPGELTGLIDRTVNERVLEILAKVEEGKEADEDPAGLDDYAARGWSGAIEIIKREAGLC